MIGEIYARTTLALRLPMWGGFATMPPVRDVPLVARRSRRDAAEVRGAFGLDRQMRASRWCPLAGTALERIDLDALSQLHGFTAVMAEPSIHCVRGSLVSLDERELYARGFRYEDLVSAVDVVVTKPGYGIIAECVANDTALLYTSRGHFIEYDVLVAHIPRFVRGAFIDHADLFAGRWERSSRTRPVSTSTARTSAGQWCGCLRRDAAGDVVNPLSESGSLEDVR